MKIIKRHDQTSPLFLEISQPAVHALRDDILQVRNEEQNEKDFAYIEDKQRRLLAGELDFIKSMYSKALKTYFIVSQFLRSDGSKILRIRTGVNHKLNSGLKFDFDIDL